MSGYRSAVSPWSELLQPWLGLTRITILAALAAWIGLWPAADAVTGASRTIYVVADFVPDPATECTTATAPNCCGSPCSAETDAPACGRPAATRCGQCFCISGLVFFTPGELPPDLQPEPQGCVTCSNCQVSTRSLQPPVPPPIGDFLINV